MYRISLGLVSLLLSVLLVARNFDILPDPDAAAIARRQALCEAVAIECALHSAQNEDLAAAAAFTRSIARRNADVLSIGLRDAAGNLAAEVGDHAEHWTEIEGDRSTPTHMFAAVPRKDGSPWIRVEASFRPLSYSGWWRFLGGSLFPLLAFSWIGWFIVANIYLRTVFRRVDIAQARVVPDQVRATLNTLAEGVVVLNRDGVIAHANEAFARAAGTSPEALRGQRVGDLPWHAGAVELREENYPWVRVLRDAVPQLGQVLGLRRGEDGKTLSINSTPIFGNDGSCRGALATFDDLTPVEKARAAAEAASKAKGEFLTNVSHEIRTPMNAIMGMTELVLEGGRLTPEQRECLGIVGESAGSLLEVINDLLDLSKIEAGKFDLDPADFDLRVMLDDTLQGLALRAHKKGLELGCDVPGDIPELLVGDSTRLRQVIVNLVGNAIKFTMNGEVFVRVRLENRAEDQVRLHFTVVDTGIGIPTDKLQAIFEPFTQADGGTTRQFGGSGLGLTISARLVQLMQGEIWAESELQRGSIFHFTANFDVPANRGCSTSMAIAPFLHGLQVMVVEDNPTTRLILSNLLGELGMRPTVADRSSEALAALEREAAAGNPFPLLLVDATMSNDGGFDLGAAAVRRELAGAVVMMLSSTDLPRDIERCQLLGAASHLRKPIRRADLLRSLRKVADPTYVSDAIAPPRPRPLPGVSGLRILVVEDNPFNQKVAAMKLERWGHRVDVVGSGSEALKAIDSTDFDVMFTDIQMPDMDGYELTDAVRRREAEGARHLPVIAMTAHAMQGVRERCLSAGMNDYVSKPIRDDDLLAALRRIIPESPNAAEDTFDRFQQDTAEFMPPAEPEIDTEAMLERVGGNRDVLRQLVGVFYQDCNTQMSVLKLAIREGDAATIRSAAHTIKGMVAFFGLDAATRAALNLEQMGTEGNLEGAMQIYGKLANELNRLESVLVEYAPSPPEGWHLGLGDRSASDAFCTVGI